MSRIDPRYDCSLLLTAHQYDIYWWPTVLHVRVVFFVEIGADPSFSGFKFVLLEMSKKMGYKVSSQI